MNKYCIIPLIIIAVLLLWPVLAQGQQSTDASSEISGYQPGVSADRLTPATGTPAPAETILYRNPTFTELIRFLKDDPVDGYQFQENRYECRHFATDMDNNAEAAGLRCGFVLLCYEKGQHALNAFETVDRGIVYIEPQTDAVVYPTVGDRYQDKEILEILIAW